MVDGEVHGPWARLGAVFFGLESLDGDGDASVDCSTGDFRGVSLAKGKAARLLALPVNGVVGLEGGMGRAGMGMGAEGE